MKTKKSIFWSDGNRVKVILKSWKGSRYGTVSGTVIASGNSLVTIHLPEGRIDFRARDLVRLDSI